MSVRSKKKEASFDVIVVGGGMTGMCAAIASARHGAKTALVQERPVFGGNASSEIRVGACGATANHIKPDLEETGIFQEILLENKRVNDYYNYSVWDRVLFTAIREQENLSMFLNTTMHDVDTEGHRITAIHCYQMTTEIEWTLRAPVFCDCTGNGTLGAFVGVKSRTGSEGKAEFNEPHAPEQPNQDRMGNTLLFKAANVGHPVKFIPPVDAMHFTQTRIATIDTYSVFFILLMYLFMWRFVSGGRWRYLALSGVFFGLGAVIILLCLGLQGREEMHYVLDKSGAHLQKWIEPGRIRCYARFLPYESYNIAKDNEGNARMLIGESHILWEDVCRYEVNKRACRIDLYRPAGFRFMTLYPEREELDAIVAYITPKMKQLVRR